MISNLKPYFVTRLKACNLNHWDAPEAETCPENKFPAFHVKVGSFKATQNQQSALLSGPVTITAFVKGTKLESGIDKAWSVFDAAFASIMASSNRLNITDVQGLTLNSVSATSYSQTNDLDGKLEMEFEALVTYGT